MDIKGNILQTVEILPARFYFYLVESNGIYSVYHRFDGSYGQKNFGDDKEQAEIFIGNQSICSHAYKELIGKRDQLIHRIAPISNKLDSINAQINALILR